MNRNKENSLSQEKYLERGYISNKRRKKSLIVLGIALSILILVGTSYAWWTTTATQTEVNVVQSSCLKLAIANEEHDISLPEAYPIPDQEGKKLEPYTFTITNNCDTPIDYTVALEMLNESNLSSDYVKYELKEIGNIYVLEVEFDADNVSASFQTKEECQRTLKRLLEVEPLTPIIKECVLEKTEAESVSYLNKLSEEPNEETFILEDVKEGKVLLQYTLSGNDSIDYKLRLWMDNDTPAIEETMNKIFQSKIVVKGEVASPGMLRTISDIDNQGMWHYKYLITQVFIDDHIYKPEGTKVLGPYDESRFGDNSVVSYLVPNEDGKTYVAHLQSNGGVTLNYDSSYLFHNFDQTTSIEGIENLDTSKARYMERMFTFMNSITTLNLGNNFDTSQVTNMSAMFLDLPAIQLNLGDKFDTSQVTDMRNMFHQVKSLTELNLGDKFDTSQATNMYHMFYGMNSLTQLELGDKFDTSQVTNMIGMFEGMYSLTTLDLKDKFDTSQVTDMSTMFANTYQLTFLNLRDKFNTSKVINMGFMFYGIPLLENLNLGDNFDTSNVVDMRSMFSGSKELNTIQYGNKFAHNPNANITGMFNDCPASKPNENTHPSWKDVKFNKF